MVDTTPFLPGLSAVHGKAVVARFDGGRLSSEGGLLVLRESFPYHRYTRRGSFFNMYNDRIRHNTSYHKQQEWLKLHTLATLSDL